MANPQRRPTESQAITTVLGILGSAHTDSAAALAIVELLRKGVREDPTPTVYKLRGPTGLGYQETRAFGHPLGWKNGVVALHRRVLYDQIGPGPHPCHWCQEEVAWEKANGNGKLYVDHLDDDRLNNDPANLVPSCMQCNIQRGRRRGRGPNKNPRRKTHCGRGHQLTPDNLYKVKGGVGRCKKCLSDYQKEHRRKKKALQTLAL